MSLKRFFMNKVLKYEIHKTAKIGFSWIYPQKLIMSPNSKIGHFNIAIHLDLISLGERSSISRSNWITGFSSFKKSKHFNHQKDRKSNLIIGNHSAITKKHHIDCTNKIEIGNFVTIAGYSSQFLTHSINIEKSIQDSYPIKIGDYCFVGTSSTILGGAQLPDFCVLGAKSLLNKSFSSNYSLYAGIPSKKVKELSKDFEYFNREVGYVY
jgi:acetyltransferase-like isoleucine patch superfamily enzyme